MGGSASGRCGSRAAFAKVLALSAVITLLLAGSACACVGSRLVYPRAIGLIFVNLFIGLFEGTVAFLVFRTRWRRSVGIMILANYVSLFTAYPLLAPITNWLEGVVFSGPRAFHLAELWKLAAAISFVLTVAFELPFCRRLMREKKRPLLNGAIFAVASQAATYLLMLMPAVYSLPRETARFAEGLAANTARTRNAGTVVYYLDKERGDLWRVGLDGTRKEFVAKAGITEERACLAPKLDEKSGKWQLWAVGETGHGTVECLLLDDIPWGGGNSIETVAAQVEEMTARGEFSRGAVDLRTDEEQAKDSCRGNIRTWACQLYRRDGHGRWDNAIWEQELKYERPFEVGRWYSLYNLPHDEAVVQVDGQIMLVDLPEMRPEFLVEGHSPFVVRAEANAVAAVVSKSQVNPDTTAHIRNAFQPGP